MRTFIVATLLACVAVLGVGGVIHLRTYSSVEAKVLGFETLCSASASKQFVGRVALQETCEDAERLFRSHSGAAGSRLHFKRFAKMELRYRLPATGEQVTVTHPFFDPPETLEFRRGEVIRIRAHNEQPGLLIVLGR